MPWRKGDDVWTDAEAEDGLTPTDAEYFSTATTPQIAWAVTALDSPARQWVAGRSPDGSVDKAHMMAFAALRRNKSRMPGDKFRVIVIRDGHYLGEWDGRYDPETLGFEDFQMVSVPPLPVTRFDWEASPVDGDVIDAGHVECYEARDAAFAVLSLIRSRVDVETIFTLTIWQKGVVHAAWLAKVGPGEPSQLLAPYFDMRALRSLEFGSWPEV